MVVVVAIVAGGEVRVCGGGGTRRRYSRESSASRKNLRIFNSLNVLITVVKTGSAARVSLLQFPEAVKVFISTSGS